MPRRNVYSASLLVYIAATSMTIAAVALPNWLSFTSPTGPLAPDDKHLDPVRVTYGLHKRCSSLTGTCAPFPTSTDCDAAGGDRYFCSMWRSVGFLMNMAVVLELALMVGYLVVLSGGGAVRRAGQGAWKMIAGLLGFSAACQCAAMGIVTYLHDHNDRFSIGWSLDKSTVLCTVSWALLAVDAAGVVAAAYMLPYDDDYEPIPDE